MRIVTQEIKDQIRVMAEDRLKDGHDVTIDVKEINEYAKMLIDLYKNNELEIEGK